MEVKLNNMAGLWYYLKPALSAWAIRFDYKLPADSLVINHITIAYSDEFDDDATKGDFNGAARMIRIRPGLSNELDCIAHELSHLVQAVCIGPNFGTMYKQETKDYTYWYNKYELEAQEAGRMATLFKQQGWLDWKEEYNTPGVYSPLSRESRNMWDAARLWEDCWEHCDFYDSDHTTYQAAKLILAILLAVYLKQRRFLWTKDNFIVDVFNTETTNY